MYEDLLLEEGYYYDSSAVAQIFDAHYDRIYSYVYRRTGHPSLSEDLAKDVFLRLLEAIRVERGPRSNLQAWLYRVAHNLIVDYYRQQAKAMYQPLEEWSVTVPQNPMEHVELEMLQEQLRQAIDRLTSDQRQVIILKFVEGLSNAQIGILLGKPEGAIKSLQHRALAAIRRQIECGELNLTPADLATAPS